jgi:hypothetical protein
MQPVTSVLSRHAAFERMPRHRHPEGYVALVLAGGYIEAGDRGRLRVEAGQAVLHGAYESHRNEFSANGAQVLNLPLRDPEPVGELGHVDDADAIVRLAERDLERVIGLDRRTAEVARALAAAHEMLHPAVPMDGPAATAALGVLSRDALIGKILREHDPRWGYTTLKGLLDEDLVQALDQLISEALGVARPPAERWRQSDDGMHVLAAGLYGLLREDKWSETGGSIERWLAAAVRRGRLDPVPFHAVAARVLDRPVDALWPLPQR